MNLQAFTLAFTLWLEDVEEDKAAARERIDKMGIGEQAEEMAVAFNSYLNDALTQLGEKYADPISGSNPATDSSSSVVV